MSTRPTTPAPAPRPSAAPTFSSDQGALGSANTTATGTATIVTVSVVVAVGVSIIVAFVILWMRRRKRARNAMYEDKDMKRRLSTARHAAAVKIGARAPSLSSPRVVNLANMPPTTKYNAAKTSPPPPHSPTGAGFAVHHERSTSAGAVNELAPSVHRRISMAGRPTSDPFYGLHATHMRHSIHNVGFDPQRLLATVGRTAGSSTAALDRPSSPEGGADSEHTSEVRSRSPPSATPRQSGTYSDVPEAASEACEAPLDAASMAQRQPTLPNLAAIVANDPTLRGYPYAYSEASTPRA
ncbi:hypothetical protein THASP1DRAFT_23068, partial [Thamnocephalis sphaerospora]